MRKLIGLLAGASGLVLAAAALAVGGGANPPSNAPPGPGTKVGTVTARDAAAGGGLKGCPSDGAANFDTYSLGHDFGQLSLTAVKRECKAPDATAIAVGAPALRQNTKTYSYGTCEQPAGLDSGCADPVSVQNFPACERNLSLYKRYPAPDGAVYPYDLTRIRGVPAAIFDDGDRIEIYTGDATVVVWGQDPDLVRKAAESLQGLHGGAPVDVRDNLPDPASNAMTGGLAC
jgi:hypothetical protein